jgi:hypothetical protein
MAARTAYELRPFNAGRATGQLLAVEFDWTPGPAERFCVSAKGFGLWRGTAPATKSNFSLIQVRLPIENCPVAYALF